MQKPNNLTEKEKRIFNRIIDNPNLVLENTSEALAKCLYSSPPALNRLAKKIGYKGYADFRLHYAINYTDMHESMHCLELNDEFSFLLNERLPALYTRIINRNSQLLSDDSETLLRIKSIIKQVNYIDIYATGSNYYFSRAMAAKFNVLGYEIRVMNYVDLDYLQSIDAKAHLAIILSRTGSNPTCIYAAEQNKSVSVRTLAVSREGAKQLSALCEFSLFVWIPDDLHPEKNVIQSFTLNYLFDFLALLFARQAV